MGSDAPVVGGLSMPPPPGGRLGFNRRLSFEKAAKAKGLEEVKMLKEPQSFPKKKKRSGRTHAFLLRYYHV